MYISKRSGIDHTVLPANTPYLPFRERQRKKRKRKKLQFIQTVNGDGSKTAKIIKRQC